MEWLSLLIGVAGIAVGYWTGRRAEARAHQGLVKLFAALKAEDAEFVQGKQGEIVAVEFPIRAGASGVARVTAELEKMADTLADALDPDRGKGP